MILDCFFSGIATKGERASALESISKEKVDEEIGLISGQVSGGGRIVLASGGKDQKSKEKDDCTHTGNQDPHPHGRFTFHLLEALDGKSGTDENGIITLDKIREHLEKEMRN
jgi:hypothetical protein